MFGGGGEGRPAPPPLWIPAFAGKTGDGGQGTGDGGRPLAAPLWIPAFAGKTGGGKTGDGDGGAYCAISS